MSLNRIENEVFFRLRQFHNGANIDSGIAKIIAVLILAEKPLNIDQISEKILISRSSTFLKLKKLEDLGLIKKEKIAKSKGFLYSMDKKVDELLINNLEKKYKGFMINIKTILEEILEEYKNKTNLKKEEERQLKILANCHKKISKLLLKMDKIFLLMRLEHAK